MTKLRRSFIAEFKLEAACLVLDQGYSVPEASRALDVGETCFTDGFSSVNQNEVATDSLAGRLGDGNTVLGQISGMKKA